MNSNSKEARIINDRADGVSLRVTLHHTKMERIFIGDERKKLLRNGVVPSDAYKIAEENVNIRHQQRQDRISNARRNMLEKLRAEKTENDLSRKRQDQVSRKVTAERTQEKKSTKEKNWFQRLTSNSPPDQSQKSKQPAYTPKGAIKRDDPKKTTSFAKSLDSDDQKQAKEAFSQAKKKKAKAKKRKIQEPKPAFTCELRHGQMHIQPVKSDLIVHKEAKTPFPESHTQEKPQKEPPKLKLEFDSTRTR